MLPTALKPGAASSKATEHSRIVKKKILKVKVTDGSSGAEYSKKINQLEFAITQSLYQMVSMITKETFSQKGNKYLWSSQESFID